MSISIYEPRSMREALKEMKPPRAALRNFFFKRTRNYQNEKVDVDVMVGARRLAPFVNKAAPAKAVERIGFTTSTVTPPDISLKRSITREDVQTRAPGEHIYAERSAEERARELLGADLADLDEMIARREEWMAAQALFTSQVRILGDNVDETIEFARDSSLTLGLLGASSRWTHSDANIPEQVRSWRRRIVKLSGANPDVMILSSEAADAMLKHGSVIGDSGALNQLRAQLGMIAPEIRDSGLTYMGEFAATGIQMFSYDEWYVDPADGVEKPMVPEKTILLGSTMADTEMRYGAVNVKTGEGAAASTALVADSRVPRSYVTEDPPVRWVVLSSRPLPVPVQNNAFLTAQVIS